MAEYNITLDLSGGWEKEESTYTEFDGTEVTHIECHLPDDEAQKDLAVVDIYSGKMPSDTTAADEALANYADIVGFDDSDPEDFDPITEWPFAGKKAYGFEALCEDESPMRLMCVELKKGLLCIMSICAETDEKLIETIELVEKKLRCKAAKN